MVSDRAEEPDNDDPQRERHDMKMQAQENMGRKGVALTARLGQIKSLELHPYTSLSFS
jgi:hypothetical protein